MSHSYLELLNIRWSRINLITGTYLNFLNILLIIQGKFWSRLQLYVVQPPAVCMYEIHLLSTEN